MAGASLCIQIPGISNWWCFWQNQFLPSSLGKHAQSILSMTVYPCVLDWQNRFLIITWLFFTISWSHFVGRRPLGIRVRMASCRSDWLYSSWAPWCLIKLDWTKSASCSYGRGYMPGRFIVVCHAYDEATTASDHPLWPATVCPAHSICS